jgi:hypothetical protein
MRTTPGDPAIGRSQSVCVAFVEKKYGSPSAGSSASNGSHAGQTRSSTWGQ